MIISLRGANGSGKSTVVRNVMKMYRERDEIRVVGRRKPVGYVLRHVESDTNSLFVPGHYEIANGGIDNLRDLDEAYDLVEKYHQKGYHVLYEGRSLADGTTRLMGRFQQSDVRVVTIDHPVDQCVASVRERGHKLRYETILKSHHKATVSARIFEDSGYAVSTCDRAAALFQCLHILQLTESALPIGRVL